MPAQPDDLIPGLYRGLDGLDLLDQVADRAGEGRVIADEQARAAIKEIAVVKVDAEKALAIFGTDVIAEYNENQITVEERFTAVADVIGQLAVAWKVTLDSNGFFGGLQLVGANGPGGLQSEFNGSVIAAMASSSRRRRGAA